jgi:hypothetical protein
VLPLILLAFGLAAAVAAYEISPRAHAVVDDYARAIRQAHAAHLAADAHLGEAHAAIGVAAHHAQAAAQHAAQIPAPTLAPPSPAPPPLAPPPLAPPPLAPPPPPVPEPNPLAVALANASQQAADAASDHVAVATEANQVAAQSTAVAAQNAKTEAERQAAAQSAAKVVDREKKIAAALASLGVGQCGVRSFSRVTQPITTALLSKLHAEGMTVTGDNPWNIETHQYDVKLRAVWDPGSQVLKLIVTAGKGGYLGLVTCDEIWKKIDPIMKGVIG